MNSAANNFSDEDTQLWNIIVDVPKLNLILAGVCGLLNFGLSGTGTILAGCLEKEAWNKTQMLIGFLQFLTAAYLIGWLLSLYWAYLIIMEAMKKDDRAAKFMKMA